MAGITTVQKQGGRKALDAAINLVPFIDLLSCCISFLLITAVWTQLAAVDAARMGKGESGSESDAPQERLTVTLSGEEITASSSNGESQAFVRRAGQDDLAAVRTFLAGWRSRHPEQNSVQIRANDGVDYARLIAAMDVAKAAKFDVVGVGDVGGVL